MPNEKVMPSGSALPTEEENVNSDVKLLGKFATAEDLAEGYTELEGLLDKQGTEVGDLRTQNAELQKNAKGDTEPDTVDDENTTSFADQEKEILGKIDAGDMELAEGLAKITELTRAATTAELEGKFTDYDNQREAQERYDDFIGANPLFQELEASGKLDEVINNNPIHDKFSAYWALKAELDATEAYRKGQEEALKIAKGADPTTLVLGGPGGQSRETPTPKRGMSQGDQASGMMAAMQASRA